MQLSSAVEIDRADADAALVIERSWDLGRSGNGTNNDANGEDSPSAECTCMHGIGRWPPGFLAHISSLPSSIAAVETGVEDCSGVRLGKNTRTRKLRFGVGICPAIKKRLVKTPEAQNAESYGIRGQFAFGDRHFCRNGDPNGIRMAGKVMVSDPLFSSKSVII